MSKIFLRTTTHEGVFYDDSIGMRAAGDLLLNLTAFERIIFDIETEKMDIKHSITFYPVYPENEMFSFCFAEEGMGEYHRMKRTIEDMVS